MNNSFNWLNFADSLLKLKCQGLCLNECSCCEHKQFSNTLEILNEQDKNVRKMLLDYHWNIISILKQREFLINSEILSNEEFEQKRLIYRQIIDTLLRLTPEQIIKIIISQTTESERTLEFWTEENEKVMESLFWKNIYSWKNILKIISLNK